MSSDTIERNREAETRDVRPDGFFTDTLAAGQTLSAMMWASQNVDESMSLLNSSGQIVATAGFDPDRNLFQTPLAGVDVAGNVSDLSPALLRNRWGHRKPPSSPSPSGDRGMGAAQPTGRASGACVVL